MVTASAVIACGELCQFNADHGVGDEALAGNTDGDVITPVATDANSGRTVIADGPGSGCAVAGRSATGAGAGSSSTTTGTATSGAPGLDVDDKRPRCDDGSSVFSLPGIAADVRSSAVVGPGRVEATARGPADGPLDTAPPAALLPGTDPRVDPDFVTLSAFDDELSAFDDESDEPGSASAIPYPVKMAAPAPKAAAKPRARPTCLEALTVLQGSAGYSQ